MYILWDNIFMINVRVRKFNEESIFCLYWRYFNNVCCHAHAETTMNIVETA